MGSVANVLTTRQILKSFISFNQHLISLTQDTYHQVAQARLRRSKGPYRKDPTVLVTLVFMHMLKTDPPITIAACPVSSDNQK